MITLKQYLRDKKQALAGAKAKIQKLDYNARVDLAQKAGIKYPCLLSYLYGNGKCFETALRIVEG